MEILIIIGILIGIFVLSIFIFILRHNDNPWREFGISRDEFDRNDINSDDIYNKKPSDPSDPWKEKQ